MLVSSAKRTVMEILISGESQKYVSKRVKGQE